MAIDRFAISLLSKSRKSDAMTQEVMINKETGEILVKSDTDFVISYDKNARLNSHIDKMTNFCYVSNVLGNMYELNFDNYDLPSVVPENVNLLSAETALYPSKISKLIISLDLDNIKIDSGESAIDIDPLIDIGLLLANNITQSTEYIENISLNLDQSNTFILEPNYPVADPGDTVDYTVQLQSITILRNNLPGDTLEFILHSVLFVLEGV